MEKVDNGYCWACVGGNVHVKTISARSCLAAGPVYEVRQREGRELLALMPVGGTTNDVLSPLEALDYVIRTIPFDHADALKRELLVGAVVNDFTDGVDAKDRVFYGQKPLTFDPISGSLTLSSIPAGMGDQGLLFRFCIRDTLTAQNDLDRVNHEALDLFKAKKPLAGLILGSMERGNKMFRYGGWESSRLYSTLEQAHLDSNVPLAGMFSQGSFGRLPVWTAAVRDTSKASAGLANLGKEAVTLMEADSMYAFFLEGPRQSLTIHLRM